MLGHRETVPEAKRLMTALHVSKKNSYVERGKSVTGTAASCVPGMQGVVGCMKTVA